LAITSGPAELPPEWATIRKYDASPQGEGQKVLEAVEHAMSYAKLPYTKERMQELARTSSSALARPLNKYPFRWPLVAALIAIISILALVVFLIAPNLQPTSPQATVTASNPATATYQAKQVATAQAFKGATLVAEASAQASATAAAPSIAQKQFDRITSTPPKFTGFQIAEK